MGIKHYLNHSLRGEIASDTSSLEVRLIDLAREDYFSPDFSDSSIIELRETGLDIHGVTTQKRNRS